LGLEPIGRLEAARGRGIRLAGCPLRGHSDQWMIASPSVITEACKTWRKTKVERLVLKTL
jgi:hypothetical protein